jgi:hypothetical protein
VITKVIDGAPTIASEHYTKRNGKLPQDSTPDHIRQREKERSVLDEREDLKAER